MRQKWWSLRGTKCSRTIRQNDRDTTVDAKKPVTEYEYTTLDSGLSIHLLTISLGEDQEVIRCRLALRSSHEG
jgi:hypothetical protein